MKVTLPPLLAQIFESIRKDGGRALLVGGFVRDLVLGIDSVDYDVEVYGLDVESLNNLLSQSSEVVSVGKAFGVLKVKGIDTDFSLPRKDSKVGKGHRGIAVETDPGLSFPDAARRRDFTINSMGLDPLTGEILDPFDGRGDLKNRVLRVTDPKTFPEDPLRPLRAVQFLSRFDLTAEETLTSLTRSMVSRGDLQELAEERVFDEFSKLLLKGDQPSRGLYFMKESGLLELFPEMSAMVGCEQEPEWHPEGDVWVHTLMALDVATTFRSGDREEDLILMLGVLCHDFGKPATTEKIDGRWRSFDHEGAGEAPTRTFLQGLKGVPERVVESVVALVKTHLTPAHWQKGSAGPGAYRRLARKLELAGTSSEMLEKVARSDHFGRTTPDALAREFPAGDSFLEKVRALKIEKEAPKDVVLGRHLIAHGFTPGPQFGGILQRCRDVQYEKGIETPEEILAIVLADFPKDTE
ncbi:MAG: polynucleotide adenylyltransferase [Planctomycetota bacterium]|nr:polynucleotide adenylyltransferase [Planctomycetota bacterium]